MHCRICINNVVKLAVQTIARFSLLPVLKTSYTYSYHNAFFIINFGGLQGTCFFTDNTNVVHFSNFNFQKAVKMLIDLKKL